MVAARVMQDRGEPPILLAYESTMRDGPNEWLEYMLFQTEESEPETLTVPMAAYDDVLRATLPHREEIYPAGKWIAWNDETAQRIWECIQGK
jgi:hypothetical protein